LGYHCDKGEANLVLRAEYQVLGSH
jgi:hypothetical protein